MTPREKAQAAVKALKEAVLEVLVEHPQGLRHADIVTILDIPSDYLGKGRMSGNLLKFRRLSFSPQAAHVVGLQERQHTQLFVIVSYKFPRHMVAASLKAEMAELTHHPLMFTFRDTISGDGFLAGITLSGRVLMLQEDGKWWMYGVRPGAIAESGATPQETFVRFRNRYREVLFDMAEEFRTFEALKEEVERFFYQPDEDEEEERRWEDALGRVRASSQALPEPFRELPREAPESRPAQITVERLDGISKRFKPSDNVIDSYFVPKVA